VPEEQEPPLEFTHGSTPRLVVALGRAVRRWQARGPRLGGYDPVSTLELPRTETQRACVPAIDFHTHLGRWLSGTGAWMEQDVPQLIDLMDACNLASLVNLDGRWGQELEDNLERYDRAYPGRFYTFCQLDWRLLESPNGPQRLVESLERSVSAGARGLKVWKDLGISVVARGRRVLPDDAALEAVWDAAGELGVPVVVHTADPLAFFQPLDRHNERLEELLRHPRNSRQEGGVQEFYRLIDSLEHVVASHPRTAIVAAHGFYPENLARVFAMFERYPNFSVDLGWVHLQLGRQPRAARALLMNHPDRVLFGTDVFPVRASMLQIYFRLLESEDEAFSYTDERPAGSGRWLISGLGLPPAVLESIYKTNARRLLGLGTSASQANAGVSP
jgi:predicted TIM-barrel fold metal-dependent hydrolase